MNNLDINDVESYINKNIVGFHEKRLNRLKNLKLNEILKKKNPYLFRAKNITLASELITGILDTHISSSEEKLFGDFLEDFSIFIAEKTCNGRKSSATGIDLEFENNNVYYIVSVKSGPNWGNSSQQRRQQQDFNTALKVLKQSKHTLNVQPVLGICYGNVKPVYHKGYLKVTGQSFWYLISHNENLYTDIVQPLGYRAKQHNDDYLKQKSRIVNTFTKKFMDDFCYDGEIDWIKLVEFNSGNLYKDNIHLI